MDILDTGIDAQGRFLDSAYNTNYGVNFVRDTNDLEIAKKRKEEALETESDEEYFDGVGMRVCFKVSCLRRAGRSYRAGLEILLLNELPCRIMNAASSDK